MLIGGQAVLVHGEPRLTLDVDVTLGVSPNRLEQVLSACHSMGVEPLPASVENFVQETFVLPVEDPESSIRIDLIFSTTDFERQAIERAVAIPIGEETVPFASAEDLIIHKLFAGRPRDLEDVAGIVRRSGVSLDWDYLEHWAEQFAAIPGREGLPERVSRLRVSAPAE